MSKKKFIRLFVLELVILMLCACGKSGVDIENHNAAIMQKEGIWTERYSTTTDTGDYKKQFERISINVYKDMSEDEMLEVLEYYELNAPKELNVDGQLVKLENYTCYAIFCKEDLDEIIAKYKYVNGKIENYTDEEEYNFVNPIMKNRNGDM